MKPLLPLFALVCAAQLAPPVLQIATHARILRRGTSCRFELQPVDPLDYFRGRYLTLWFAPLTLPLPAAAPVQPGEWVHVSIEVDAGGIARPRAIALAPPVAGPYLTMRVGWVTADSASLVWPFERYYLPEEVAPRADELYAEMLQRGRNQASRAHALVRVLDGRGVVEDVLFDGVPVVEYVRARG